MTFNSGERASGNGGQQVRTITDATRSLQAPSGTEFTVYRNPQVHWEEWPKSSEARRPIPTPPGSILMSLQSCLHRSVLSSIKLCMGHAQSSRTWVRGVSMFICIGEGANVLGHRIWHLRGTGTQESQPPVPGAGVIPLTGFQINCWGQWRADIWLGPSRPILRLCVGLKQNFWT